MCQNLFLLVLTNYLIWTEKERITKSGRKYILEEHIYIDKLYILLQHKSGQF